MKWKWHPQFSEDSRASFRNTVIYIKNGFPFWNVQFSCLFNYINLWQSVLILWWATTNKSKYGKHLCHEHKLTLGFWFWRGRSGHQNRSHWPVEYLYQRAGSSGRPGSQMGSTKTFTEWRTVLICRRISKIVEKFPQKWKLADYVLTLRPSKMQMSLILCLTDL